jgi:hypothetical protein
MGEAMDDEVSEFEIIKHDVSEFKPLSGESNGVTLTSDDR